MRLLLVTAAAATILALAVVLGTQHLRRRFTPTCTTCGTRSGWTVTGHTDLQCREYVQEQRRRAIAHSAAIGRPAPDLTHAYGHAWPIDR